MLHLKIAQAAIVEARIAENMIKRGVRRDIASRLADDDRKLALEIELVRGARANKRPAMRHNGIEHPDEQAGKFGQLQAGLGDMAAIIAAYANDLAWFGDRRQEADIPQSRIAVIQRRRFEVRPEEARGYGVPETGNRWT
jgi:hypothetical protein